MLSEATEVLNTFGFPVIYLKDCSILDCIFNNVQFLFMYNSSLVEEGWSIQITIPVGPTLFSTTRMQPLPGPHHVHRRAHHIRTWSTNKSWDKVRMLLSMVCILLTLTLLILLLLQLYNLVPTITKAQLPNKVRTNINKTTSDGQFCIIIPSSSPSCFFLMCKKFSRYNRVFSVSTWSSIRIALRIAESKNEIKSLVIWNVCRLLVVEINFQAQYITSTICIEVSLIVSRTCSPPTPLRLLATQSHHKVLPLCTIFPLLVKKHKLHREFEKPECSIMIQITSPNTEERKWQNTHYKCKNYRFYH